MSTKIASLQDYLATLDDARATTVKAIVDTIQAEFPTATVKIAWNVPQMQIDGQYVFGIAAAKHHLTLASWNPANFPSFADRLAGYVVNKGTFQVPIGWEPDRELIRDFINDRLQQLANK